jgi:hypothetical protein
MSDAEIRKQTDLILKGSIARIPVSIQGTFSDGKVTEFSGTATIRKSLKSFLNDLGIDFGEAAGVLEQLAGDNASSLALEELVFAYHTAVPKYLQIMVTMSAGAGRCRFAILKNIGNPGFMAGLDLQSDEGAFDKKKNFLFGLIGDIKISDLGLYYASEALPKVKFPSADRVRDFTQGLNFSAEIIVGGVNLLDMLGSQAGPQAAPVDHKTPPAPAPQALPAAKETPLAKEKTKWIEANKTIGPLSIQRIGLGYEAPRIAIKLDAGLKLSCLTFNLLGLGLSYPLDQFTTDPKKIWQHLRFLLDGAAVIFEQGPLTIAGGLLKVSDDPLQLDGTLLIRTKIFTIAAIGSYADLDGTPSFFVFAALQKELGGPAFFFVVGLSFGFGLNRALKLPTINEVQNFPLVQAATNPDYLGKDLDLRMVSRKLGVYIYPSVGNFWIAAGIKFTSFGLVNSFALLSVSFGTQFEIALLGTSKLQIPPVPGASCAPVIVSVEMAFKIAFSTESGLLSFEARLTENSYVLRKDFMLRGGFAFYSWFAGEHEGDFVISLGGYHPRFQPPAHYPKPDLVSFICKIGPVTIKGYCYFALCPSVIMAGGGLSIVFQSGGIRAWFIAYADFLVQWRPLFYDIVIGISIGVALNLKIGIIRISISLELSAAVELHGPPLGGKARISLWIITFTVKFGEAKRLPPPLGWESENPEKSFAKSFLPNPDVTRISLADGLLQEVKDNDNTHRLVNPHKLVLSCRTLVPATDVLYNGQPPVDGNQRPLKIPQPEINGKATELGVRPMGKATLYSRIDVMFEPEGGASEAAGKYLAQYIDVSLTTHSIPLALWGSDAMSTVSPPRADEQMIDHALVGLEIRTKPGPRPWQTPVLDLKVLAYDPYRKNFNGSNIAAAEAQPAFGDATISNTINKPDVVGKRNQILRTLIAGGRNTLKPEAVQLDQLAQNAEFIFQAMPAMARAGQYPPRGYLDT